MKATLEDHHKALSEQQFNHIIREAFRQALRDRKAIDDKPHLEKLKCIMEMELDAQARAAALHMIGGGSIGKPDMLFLELYAVHQASILLGRAVLDEPEFNT